MKSFRSVFLSLGLLAFAAMSALAEPPKPTMVNINSATAEQIAVALDGIGMSKAMAIVDHRKRYGEFKHVDSLESVKGVGKSTVEKNRTRIKIQ